MESTAPPTSFAQIFYAKPDPDLLLGANGLALLRRIAILMVVGGIASALNNAVSNGLQWQGNGGLLVSLLCTLSYALLSMGKTRLGVLVLVWGTGLTVLGITFIASGVRTPALIFLPILCITAAWLLGLRSALALGIAALATIFFFVIAEHYGYTPPNAPRNSVAYALIYFFSFVGVTIVAWGAHISFQNQLQRTLDLSADLQGQVEELRHSEERFSALFRANPVPSSTNDADGRIIDVNDAWVALYGIAAQDAIGKTPQEAGIASTPEERKKVYLEMAQHGRVNGAPITLQTADGVRKPFLLYIAPVEFGGQRRLVTSMLDQSDRQAAEAAQNAIHHELEARVAARTAELSQALETLKTTQAELVQSEKLASLGAMVAGISHELNTPIGNAVTVSSTLQSRVNDLRKVIEQGQLRRSTLTYFMADVEQMTDLILRSSERAAEQIRSFKQVAVDLTSERRRSFDLQDLVHDIVTSIQPGMRHAGITIAQDIPIGIICDSLPGPIGQVLTNLIQNAVLHAFEARQTGRISIASRVQGHGAEAQVVLTVSDDGVGMSEHTRRHAFDPFFTTRMGQGGSGLGLSVSHRLATTVLGGNLSVQSERGRGCCFTFCWLQRLPKPA